MDFDGLCGIIASFSSSDNQIRCQYELGHHGPCSFEKYRHHFYIMGGCGPGDWLKHREVHGGDQRGFIESVLSHQEK